MTVRKSDSRRWQRPCVRAMLVGAHVSLMNTSLSPVELTWLSRKAALRFRTILLCSMSGPPFSVILWRSNKQRIVSQPKRKPCWLKL